MIKKLIFPGLSIRSSGILIFAAAILILSVGPLTAAPDWIREIPRNEVFSYTAGVITGGTSAVAARDTGALKITTQIDSKQVHKYYALRLGASANPENLLLKVNGIPFEQVPVLGDDGFYYQISPRYLVIGENVFSFSSKLRDDPKINEAEMFSLEGSYEEVHFGRAFSSSVPRVQPPTHADQDKYDAIHYDLTIALDMSSTYIDAVLLMNGQSLDGTLSSVVLDLNDNGGSMSVSAVDNGAGTPLAYTHNGSLERLFITLPSAVPAGNTFTVRVYYSGTPATGGAFGPGYNRTTHSGTPMIYTFSEPYKSRVWWPCKDVPEDKATMDLHITCPTAYTAISNGSLSGPVDNFDGTHTFNWSESYNLATYLVSICCTNYTPASGTYTALDTITTMEVAHYVYPESYAFDSLGLPGTIDILEFFAQTFGEYPFLTEKYYTATHASGSGMEHQTCTSMPNNDVGIDAGEGRRNIHELAHMWFGDLITMEHFDHLWLNEGFATYCEALYYEQRDGTAAYHTFVNNWSTSDSYPIISTSADAFSGSIVYRKGAWVLHMLRKVMGDTDFFQAIRNYVADPSLRYGNALTDDFRLHCEALYGSSMSWFFDEWLLQAARPNYTWQWGTHIDGVDTILDITLTQTQGGSPYEMPIEFEVFDLGGGSSIVTVWNDASPQLLQVNLGSTVVADVVFDPDNWLLEYKTENTDAPNAPTLSSATHIPGFDNRVRVTWVSGGGTYLDGFEVYYSESLTGWTIAAGKAVLGSGATTYDVTGLTPGLDYYFKVRGMSTTDSPGDFSDTYGCRPSSTTPPVLIVDGHDRTDTTQPEDTYYFGDAVDDYGLAFDTCDNAVLGVTVTLTDYDIVLWMLGEESTVDQTFSSTERALTETFLNGGGSLFVSGAEIGWDIGRSGSSTAAEIAFYNNYLKATYVADDSNTHQAQGDTGLAFDEVGTFNFDDGSWKQDIDWPDRLGTSGGSSACMTYVGGTADTAAVQFSGAFNVINMGFPFESIIGQTARQEVMNAVLDFFGNTNIDSWMLF